MPSVTQKPNYGRSREARIKALGAEVVMEAIAQANRQIDFERQRKDEIVRSARTQLNACEQRVAALLKQISDLRDLAGEIESAPVAA